MEANVLFWEGVFWNPLTDRHTPAAHWLKVILKCCILWDYLVPGIPFDPIMVLLEPVWGPGLLVLLETSLKSWLSFDGAPDAVESTVRLLLRLLLLPRRWKPEVVWLTFEFLFTLILSLIRLLRMLLNSVRAIRGEPVCVKLIFRRCLLILWFVKPNLLLDKGDSTSDARFVNLKFE